MSTSHGRQGLVSRSHTFFILLTLGLATSINCIPTRPTAVQGGLSDQHLIKRALLQDLGHSSIHADSTPRPLEKRFNLDDLFKTAGQFVAPVVNSAQKSAPKPHVHRRASQWAISPLSDTGMEMEDQVLNGSDEPRNNKRGFDFGTVLNPAAQIVAPVVNTVTKVGSKPNIIRREHMYTGRQLEQQPILQKRFSFGDIGNLFKPVAQVNNIRKEVQHTVIHAGGTATGVVAKTIIKQLPPDAQKKAKGGFRKTGEVTGKVHDVTNKIPVVNETPQNMILGEIEEQSKDIGKEEKKPNKVANLFKPKPHHDDHKKKDAHHDKAGAPHKPKR